MLNELFIGLTLLMLIMSGCSVESEITPTLTQAGYIKEITEENIIVKDIHTRDECILIIDDEEYDYLVKNDDKKIIEYRSNGDELVEIIEIAGE